MKLWIARNKSGKLFMYTNRHEIVCDGFYFGSGQSLLDNDLFPEVTFENSPREVELKLMNEIVGIAESPLKTFPRINEFEVGGSYRR